MNPFARSRSTSRLLSATLTAALIALGIGIVTSAPAAAVVNCAATSGTAPDLTGCDLRGKDFSAATWTKPIFSNANLAGATFAGVSAAALEQAKFYGANVSGANFTGLSLKSADFRNANAANANFSKTTTNASTYFGGSTLTGADLTDADWSAVGTAGNLIVTGNIKGSPKLPTAVSQSLKVVGGYILGTGFSSAGADVSGADLSTVTFAGAGAGKVTGTPSKMPASGKYQVIGGYILGPSVNLTDANLRGFNLDKVDLTSATFKRTIGGGITGTPTALPFGITLTSGFFVGAGVSYAGGDLSALDLSNADMTGVASGGITKCPKSLPVGWKCIGGYLLGMSADLTGADLKNLDLSGVTLSAATLSGVKSGGIKTTGTSLPQGWILLKGYLVGPGASLNGANFTGATFASISLNGVDLSGTTLANVSSNSVSGSPTLPAGWALTASRLVGPGANLAGATLNAANLTNVDLRTANLAGTFIKGITASEGVQLPAGWKIVNVKTLQNVAAAILLGPGVKLGVTDYYKYAGADLNGLNFSDGALAAGDLSGTSFAGANLARASITNVKADASTDLSGATAVTGLRLTVNTAAGIGPSGWASYSYTAGGVTNYNWYGPGGSLANAQIQGQDFSAADFTGVISGGIANIAGTKFPAGYSVQSGYIVGPKANLDGARLTSSLNLTGVDLSGASLKMVMARGLLGAPSALPAGWKVINGVLLGPTADLGLITNFAGTGADLTAMDLTGLDLSGANLKGAKTGKIKKAPAKLPANWVASGAMLLGPGADISGANVDKLDLSKAKLDAVLGEDLVGTPKALPAGVAIIKGKLFASNQNWDNENLTGYDLSKVNLSGATFKNATLTGAKLTGANLTDANLTGADLTKAVLTGANLTRANFTSNMLTTATLTSATVTDMQFNSPGDATGLVSGSLSGLPASMPSFWKIVKGYFVGDKVNLTNADLSGADLADASMNDAIVTGVKLAGCLCSGLSLASATGNLTSLPAATGWKYSKGTLFGPRVNITGAVDAGTDLSGADLTQATIGDVFAGKVKSGPYTGTIRQFASWSSTVTIGGKQYLAGPGVDFTGFDLSGLDLSQTDLSRATLTNAKLAGTAMPSFDYWLAKTVTGGVSGTPTGLPQGFKVSNGLIVGKGVSLAGADLNAFDFTGFTDLSGTDFTGAKVTNTNLANMKLQNTDFSKADLSNTTFAGADFSQGYSTSTLITGAKVEGTTFTGAKVEGMMSGGVTGAPKALPSNSFKLTGGYLVGPAVNLTKAKFVNADLSGADITNASMDGVTFSKSISGPVTGQPTCCGYPTLAGGYFLAAGVDLNGGTVTAGSLGDISLAGADLSGVTFKDTTFSNVNFAGANVTNADFTTSGFSYGNKSGGLIGVPKVSPNGVHVAGGFFLGNGVDLSGADFKGANMNGADIANLDLSGVKLAGVSSGKLTGTPYAMPSGYIIAAGYFVGPGVNLTGANLGKSNLSKVSLNGANLTNAVLATVTLGAGPYTGIVGTPKSLPKGWTVAKGTLKK